MLATALAWAELTGRLDEPCPASQTEANANQEPPGFVLSVTPEGATYHYRPQANEECEEADWWEIPLDGWVALTTLMLVIATLGLAVPAWRALRDSEEAHARQLRAYVSIELPDPQPTGLRGQLALDIKVMNSGATPALGAVSMRSQDHFDPDLPDDFYFADMKGGRLIGSEFMLGPGQSTHIVVGTWDVEEMKRLAARVQGRFIVWGWVEYDDIFAPKSERRRTEYCFEVVAELDPKSGVPGLRCRHRGKFNASDGDCLRPVQTTSRRRIRT